MKFKFISFLLIIFSSIVLMSCGIKNSSGPTPSATNQKNYLYVGAPGYNLGTVSGTVYKCDLSTLICTALPHSNITLANTVGFGSSIFATNSHLYIGAPSFDSVLPNYPGAVYDCDLNGNSCSALTFSGVTYSGVSLGVGFGSSLYFDAPSNKLFIGAANVGADDSATGSVFSCDVTSLACTSVGHSPINYTGGDESGFGSSISLVGSRLFIGVKTDINYTYAGSVLNCNLSGSACTSIVDATLGAKIYDNSGFGHSLFSTATKLYVGAPGRGPSTSLAYNKGSVYGCDLTGNNCTQLTNSGLTLSSFDKYGSSIFATDSGLFVGAPGTNSNKGAVYRCDLNGANCLIVNFTGLNLQNNDNFGASLYYSSQAQ